MLKLGIIQTKNYKSNEEGIKKISKVLHSLGKKNTQIVCLPEQWLKDNEIVDYDLEFQDLKTIAKKYKMTIIIGAFYQKKGKNYVISSPVIGPNGHIIGQQEKIHPFDLEKKIVKPGKEAKIFHTSCKFGVVICYDMVFPKVIETLVKKGAKVIFSPSRIVKNGITPWKIYAQSRALENRVPILAANVKNRKFGGNSMIIDLVEKDKIILTKLTKIKDEDVMVEKLDLTKYEKSRRSRFSDARQFV